MSISLYLAAFFSNSMTSVARRLSRARVWAALAIRTVPPADSVDVGVAVGGHDRTVPHGGHSESSEYQENTLAAPCTLEHIQPSLRQENQELDLRLACIE